MCISLDNVMAIVVDFQEKLVPAMHDKENLIKRTEILLKGLHALNIPTITTQQYTQGLGMTIPELRNILGNDYIDKKAFSCYKDICILEKIKELNKRFVIVCGIETHICIMQTCIDLLDAGFIPILITDCTSSRKESDKEISLVRMANHGTIFSTSESILFELMGSATHPAFREISKLIK
ncbi:MAG: isochorismatase family protein [Eubacteriales bacterium]